MKDEIESTRAGAGKWEGAEEWMPLAWELCANEGGEDSCEELIWEGGPIKEPWGERWLKYEDQAKEMIAMVRKHVPVAAAPAVSAPAGEPTDAMVDAGKRVLHKCNGKGAREKVILIFKAMHEAGIPSPVTAPAGADHG